MISDSISTTTLTHYEVLRIQSTATNAEIKAAYYKLARMRHPDKQQQQVNGMSIQVGDDDDAENAAKNTPSDSLSQESLPFPVIQAAWETLRDTEKRKKYDDELLHKEMAEKKSDNGAITISRNELQEAVDDETGETFHVYDCRCGEQLEIDDITEATTTIDCPGCCFVYRLVEAA